MTQKASPKKKDSGSGIGMAAVATAGVAAIAGAIFLYGTDSGKKKRKDIKSWAIKARGEVVEKLEKAKEINENVYNNVVDSVVDKYKKIKSIDAAELAALGLELRRGWTHIKREVQGLAKKPAPAKKRTVARAPRAPRAKKTAAKTQE